MWPGLNLLHPDMSDSLLQYRVNRIAGAEEKALSYSPPFGGAMFPWESALTGEEVCPTWAATGLREIHINGDIAFAVWQFWRATQDNSGAWLNSTAWPLLSGIATFWMSKLALDNPGAAPGSPLSLLNVIPPDEYADHANNSAYTNAGAIYTLQYAAAVASLLGEPPASYAPWLDAAARIIVPYDAANGYTPEYDGYKRGQQIKQADVILLGFPFDFPRVSDATRAAEHVPHTKPGSAHRPSTSDPHANPTHSLDYYATVTDPGSVAMTWGMFSVGYIELGPSCTSQRQQCASTRRPRDAHTLPLVPTPPRQSLRRRGRRGARLQPQLRKRAGALPRVD